MRRSSQFAGFALPATEHYADPGPIGAQVECLRCDLRLGARLHRITSTDAQECPRCWGLDGIEVPMFVIDGSASPRSTAA